MQAEYSEWRGVFKAGAGIVSIALVGVVAMVPVSAQGAQVVVPRPEQAKAVTTHIAQAPDPNPAPATAPEPVEPAEPVLSSGSAPNPGSPSTGPSGGSGPSPGPEPPPGTGAVPSAGDQSLPRELQPPTPSPLGPWASDCETACLSAWIVYYVNWAEPAFAVRKGPVLEAPTGTELVQVQAMKKALREEIAKREAYEANRARQREGAARQQQEREQELANNPPDAISGADPGAEQEGDDPGPAPRLTDNECPGSYQESIYLVEEGRSGSNACF